MNFELQNSSILILFIFISLWTGYTEARLKSISLAVAHLDTSLWSRLNKLKTRVSTIQKSLEAKASQPSSEQHSMPQYKEESLTSL